MTDAALGADAGFARHHCGHDLVRVQAALHQRLGAALAHERHSARRGAVTVLGGDDGEFADVELGGGSDGANLGFRANQNRLDQAHFGGLGRRTQRCLVAG